MDWWPKQLVGKNTIENWSIVSYALNGGGNVVLKEVKWSGILRVRHAVTLSLIV